MRRIALVTNGHPHIKRVIMYQHDDGVYLFPCATLEDGSAVGDNWFATVAEAEEACCLEYGIDAHDWQETDDPLDGCQHDWIAPVRIKCRGDGQRQWGHFERLQKPAYKAASPKSLVEAYTER